MRGGNSGRRGRVPAGAAGDALPPEPPGRTSETFGLQLVLSQLGYTGADGAPLQTDARFGPDTRRALQAFQRDHGLAPADGVLDAATRDALVRAARGRSRRDSG
jgi:peptidoglycan hydrolase-like protein with peptidoglycan-binding domain